MKKYTYNDIFPKVDQDAYLADDVVVTGDVTIHKKASIWFGTVIRGDVAPTIIGERTNIQDQCMLHQSPDLPLIIGDGVTVGHQCMLHSCVIRDNALVGMGSIVLDGAEIGKGAYLGAGSLVAPGKKIPPGKLAFGRPAKVIRDLTKKDIDEMNRIREGYVLKGQAYKNQQS